MFMLFIFLPRVRLPGASGGERTVGKGIVFQEGRIDPRVEHVSPSSPSLLWVSSQPGKLVYLMSSLWKCVSYLIMASSGVECVLCLFMCFPHDSFLCSSTIRPICHSNAYSQWHRTGCSFSAAQCFLKETHT